MKIWYESKIFTFSFNVILVGFMIFGGLRIFCPDDLTECFLSVINNNIFYNITILFYLTTGVAFFMFLMDYFK